MFNQKYKTHLMLFGGSFILRIIVLFVLFWWITSSGLFSIEQQSVFPALNGDSEDYLQIAQNITQHGVFSSSFEEPFQPNTFRTPLYPSFLAFIFTIGLGKIGAILIQIALASATTVLVYMLARRFFSYKIALLAGVLFAIEPYSVFISDIFLTETLFTFLITFSIYLLTHKSTQKRELLFICGAGLTLGLATLTRPVSMFLIPLGAIFIAIRLWGRYRLKSVIIALIFLIFSILPLTPWMIRNHQAFGVYQLASNSWNNALFWNVSMHRSLKTGESLDNVVKDYEKQISPTTTASELKSFKYVSKERELAISYLKENWLSYSKFHLVKTIPFFISDGFREIASFLKATPQNSLPNFTDTILRGDIKSLIKQTLQGGVFTLLFFTGLFLWTLISILTILGIYFGLKKDNTDVKWFVFMSAALILYFAFIGTPLSPGRMRFVVEPLTFILTAVGLVGVFTWWRKNSSNDMTESTKDARNLSSNDFV